MLLRTLPHERTARRSAFTLMEMIIVVAIILIVASLGGYYVMGQMDQAKVSQAKIKARNIGKAIDTYKIDNGEFPPNLEALLTKNPQTGTGPYLISAEEILDPWNREYQYDPSGQRNAGQAGAAQGIIIPDVFTTTPDGRIVGNWSDNKK